MIPRLAPVLIAVGLTGAAPAQAAPEAFSPNEQAFLRELSHDDIPVGSDVAMVDLGHRICGMLANGYSEKAVMGSMHSDFPDAGLLDLRYTLDAAATYLCPEQEQGRPNLGLPSPHGW